MTARQTAYPAFFALLGLSACQDETLNPSEVRRSEATPLGIYDAERDDDARVEARRAFERDARRREARFLDAAKPGYLLTASRPEAIEIESGLWSPAELYQLGAQLFHHDFDRREGLGGKDVPYPTRFAVGFRGDVATSSCRSCHVRGGVAGAGDAADNAYLQGDGDHQSTALSRNAPALVGAGWIELAAREMSNDLARQRDAALSAAAQQGRTVRVELTAKGISFGALSAAPNGAVDLAELRGVDGDLVVRPFGRKGTFATLREAVEDELASRLGLQSTGFVAADAELAARAGTFGGDDPDGDGVREEIGEGQLTALTLMVAMQEVPIVEMPNTPLAPIALWAEGRAQFEAIGCATCHTPRLVVESGVFTLPSREDGATIEVDLEQDGADPRLRRSAVDDALGLELYSDLRRHDLGPTLAESRDDRGIVATSFITPPLWGLARSRPYLHDGRAPTLHDAIVAHDGEALSARDQYLALGEAGQAPIRVFLLSLTRAPSYVVP